MTKNIEKDFIEQASKVDVAAIDTRLGELRGEMATLVKLSLTAGVDTEIYGEEYHRINGEMEELRGNRAIVTQAEIVRRETLEKVREIDKALRGMDDVQEFDEGLFGMLVERVMVMNIVQVQFVLRSGIRVTEVI